MLIIKEGIEKISKLWFVSNIKNLEEYRPIKFLLELEVQNGILLCNAVSGELIFLSDEEKHIINQNDESYMDIREFLIKHRFLVPVNYDEEKSIEQLRDVLCKLLNSKNINSFNILPTTNCNARCFYCYQSDFLHINMTDKKMYSLLDFIERHNKEKNIHIGWFGGEPTVGKKRIDKICEELINRGINYNSTMISNGYLFDEALISHAKNFWKLKKIQITIDGTEEVYNTAKAYVSVSENPYQKVLNNIELFSKEDIEVQIRLNLDTYNMEDLRLLIDELSQRFSKNNKVGAYVSIIMPDVGYNPLTHEDDDFINLENYKLELEQALIKGGLLGTIRDILPHLEYQMCMADNPNSIQCSPDGILSKCEHFIYDSKVGTLESDEFDSNVIQYWKERDFWECCKGCPLIPYCLHLKNCPANKQKCHKITKHKKINNFKKNMMYYYMNKDKIKE